MKKYYVVEDDRNDKDLKPPYCFKCKWTPELPKCAYSLFYPVNPSEFNSDYKVKVVGSGSIKGDFFKRDDIVSNDMITVCDSLNINYFHIPIEIQLMRKKLESGYNLFFLLDYIQVLDLEQSIYEVSMHYNEERPILPYESSLYDTVSKFVIKNNIDSDLFVSIDIYEVICSENFKNKYEERGLKGVTFTSLDEYKYDPLAKIGVLPISD